MKVSKLSTVVLPLFFALGGLVSMTADASIVTNISIGGQTYNAVVDTGAEVTVIPKRIARSINLGRYLGKAIMVMADRSEVPASMYYARISINNEPPKELKVAVFSGASQILVGMNALDAFDTTIKASSRSVVTPGGHRYQHQRRDYQHTRAQHSPAPISPYVEGRYQGEVSPGC